MKKKIFFVICGLGIALWHMTASAPHAKADYFNYPCQPPGVGTGVQVHIIIDASGQFCDGPTEINLTHYHCEAGGGGISGGAIGIAPAIGGLTLGGFGGGGFGGGGDGCSWRCPDNTLAPAPNPPGVGAAHYIDVRAVIKANKAFCVVGNHLTAAGPTSELVSPDEGFPPAKDAEPYQVGNGPMPNQQLRPEEDRPQTKVPEATPAPTSNVPLPAPVPAIPEVPAPAIPNVPIP